MLSPLILILGFVFAFVEFKVPGFGIPGMISIACFAIVLFGRYLVGLADVAAPDPDRRRDGPSGRRAVPLPGHDLGPR